MYAIKRNERLGCFGAKRFRLSFEQYPLQGFSVDQPGIVFLGRKTENFLQGSGIIGAVPAFDKSIDILEQSFTAKALLKKIFLAIHGFVDLASRRKAYGH